jgi:ATP-dependent helicase IRC3
MSKKQKSDFYREYNLTQARKNQSSKTPAFHQAESLNKLHEWFDSKPSPHAGGILVLPTGSGKTFAAIRFLCTGPLSEGYKVLWLAHTHHLLEQAFYNFGPKEDREAQRVGYEVGWISEPKQKLNVRVISGTPGHFPVHQIKTADDVAICTIQTVVQAYKNKHPRLTAFLDAAGDKLIVVFDEAHHSPAPSYRKLIIGLREQCLGMYLLGLTATPTYTDEKKRGWLKELFPQGIIYQTTPQKLIPAGILAKPILKSFQTDFKPEFDEREYRKWVSTYRDIPEKIITELALSRDRNTFIADTYAKNQDRYKKTIVFADRWFQCDQLRELLQERNVRADVIYSHVDADPGSAEARNRRQRDENAQVLDAFRRNELDVLINVRMLTEGTDVPDVQTIFLTRQTTSSILLTQMIGRALRGPKFGGTEQAHIVSFIDNWMHLINWAEYDQLAGKPHYGPEHEYGKRPPLHLISIDLVRRLIRQIGSGLNVSPAQFITLMPIGWYRVEFVTSVEGSDDYETVRQLLMVFDKEKESYENFIKHLKINSVQFLNRVGSAC